MAVLDVLNINGEKVSTLEVADDVFNLQPRKGVLHQVVRMQLASRRAGTASVKHRSDVRGSTRKLFRQKGTGRARRGDIKSPLLRGGGSVFGPDPRSYSFRVPKKVKRLALKMALSSKFREDAIKVVDSFELEQIRTKDFVGLLKKLGVENVLIVTDGKNRNLELSSRNVPKVKVLQKEGLNVYDILKYRHLVMLAPVVKSVEGRLLS